MILLKVPLVRWKKFQSLQQWMKWWSVDFPRWCWVIHHLLLQYYLLTYPGLLQSLFVHNKARQFSYDSSKSSFNRSHVLFDVWVLWKSNTALLAPYIMNGDLFCVTVLMLMLPFWFCGDKIWARIIWSMSPLYVGVEWMRGVPAIVDCWVRIVCGGCSKYS